MNDATHCAWRRFAGEYMTRTFGGGGISVNNVRNTRKNISFEKFINIYDRTNNNNYTNNKFRARSMVKK